MEIAAPSQQRGILPPELKSIQQLFTGDTKYIVPVYQRSFAWGEDEIEELWSDIMSAANRRGEYFLGTIVLQKSDNNRYEIIDGQQRLACLTMLFSAIRSVFQSTNDPRAEQVSASFLGSKDFKREAQIEPKLQLNRVSDEIFFTHIIGSKTAKEVKDMLKQHKLLETNKLLLKAYLFFLEKISTEAPQKGVELDQFIVPLIDCLRSAVKLITITVLSGEDANLFFESLNARGKELAVSDLVKNRLYTEARGQVQRAEQLWEQMENELARKAIPEYLRHFWIAKKADDKSLIVREKQLYRSIVEHLGGREKATIELLKEIAVSANDYVKIGDYNLWPDDEAYGTQFEECIGEMQLFRVVQCNPLLLNAIQLFKTPIDIAKVFRIVVNFSFRYFIIGNQSPGNLERETNRIAYEIRIGALSGPSDVADAFRSINPDLTFRSDFEQAAFPKSRAKIARYTLAKINNFLVQNSGDGELIVNPDEKQVNLEHVLPQSLPASWNAFFSTDEDPAEYVDQIGNLTLLKKSLNAIVGDSSFSEKQSVLCQSALPLNKNFQTFNKWGESEIVQRQRELAKVAVQVWRLG